MLCNQRSFVVTSRSLLEHVTNTPSDVIMIIKQPVPNMSEHLVVFVFKGDDAQFEMDI